MNRREPLIIRNTVETHPEASIIREWLGAYDGLVELFKENFGINDTAELERVGVRQPTCAIMRYAVMKRMLGEKGISTDQYPEYHELFPNYVDFGEGEYEEYLLHRYGSRRYVP